MGVTTTKSNLYMWGCNQYGQLGNPSVKTCSLVPKEDGKKYIEVACGLTHTLVLNAEGLVFSAGDNDEGQ